MTECPRHPGAESVGACARCGRFYCAAERIELDRSYCGDCGVRDDVDWLGKHYAPYVGRRSALSWFLLALGLVVSAGSVAGLAGSETWKERGFFGGLFVLGGAALTVMSGQAWSRWAMLASVPVAGALFAISSGEPWAAMIAFPSLLLTLSVFNDVPTSLYFRLPVGRHALRKHFDREGSNPLAVRASRLAVLSLLVPGLSAVTLVLGVIALTRVNSKAIPPVGNVSAALGAIVFSLFTSFIWLALLLGVP